MLIANIVKQLSYSLNIVIRTHLSNFYDQTSSIICILRWSLLAADDNDDDGDEKPSISKPVIIGACIGGFVVVAVIMIGLYVYYKRTRPCHNNVGDRNGMPNDDACEKYELKPTEDEKENVLWVEENGLNNEGAE